MAATRFDAFVTSDSNLEYQQPLHQSGLVVIVLVAPSNDINALLPLVPKVIHALATATKGQLIKISG